MLKKGVRVLVAIMLLFPLSVNADSGDYNKFAAKGNVNNSDLFIVSNGHGYYYRYFNGKYYPVRTTHGNIYAYGGQYNYKRPANKNIEQENEVDTGVYDSSGHYPIYFD